MKRTPIALTLATLALVSCSRQDATPDPTVKAVGVDHVGITFDHVAQGTSMVQPLRTLCTTGKPTRIKDVVPWDGTGGMRITSWGTRFVGPHTRGADNPKVFNPGGIKGLVNQVPGFGHKPVTVSCKDSERSDANVATQLDVSFAGASPRATMKGVILHLVGGATAKVQYSIAMCSTAQCANLD